MARCFQVRRSKSWFKDFQYNPENDKAGDIRDIHLIIATLIAAVTFQAGVNPPGGTAIYASREAVFYVFLAFNTLALSTSVVVILSLSLTCNLPFKLEVFVGTASMLGTYASAIFAVTPADYSFRFRYILIAGALPFVLRVLIYMLRYRAKEEMEENLCCNCKSGISEDNSCRRCGSEISKVSEDVNKV